MAHAKRHTVPDRVWVVRSEQSDQIRVKRKKQPVTKE
jgi:hypothetical protein